MADNLISRIYSNFRGVDFRGEEINLVRSPDSLNVWKDYKETESIRTRPDLDLNIAFDDTVYGIFFFKDKMLVHSGPKLYEVVNGVKTEIYTGLKKAVSCAFAYENEWYFKDGKHYLKYDGTTISDVIGYVPTTSIARFPKSGGKDNEDTNLLQPRRINTFLADGNNKEFWLDRYEIDIDFPPIVKVDDKVVSNYTVDYEGGKIIFDEVSTGAANDIQRATDIIRSMITVYGMDDKIGPISLKVDDPYELQIFGDKVIDEVGNQVQKLIDDAYQTAQRILRDNMDILDAVANTLLEKEKITTEEFEEFFK